MDISITDASDEALGVSRKTLSKIVNGKGSVTPEMAVRLSIALGSSHELRAIKLAVLWVMEHFDKKMRDLPGLGKPGRSVRLLPQKSSGSVPATSRK